MIGEFVAIDRNTLKAAEEAARADAQSCVVRHAEVETASARARRLATTHTSGRLLTWPTRGVR